MKKVIEIDRIVEVQDDYIECSVCGRYKELRSFQEKNEEGKLYQSRTNCEDCYNLPHNEFIALIITRDKRIASPAYKRLEKDLKFYKEFTNYSVSVKEMIESLKTLDENDRLVMSQAFLLC